MNSLKLLVWLGLILLAWSCKEESATRTRLSLNKDWQFALSATDPDSTQTKWESLDVPHDWSIAGEFSESNPAGVGGGALPGGIGWYKKTFSISESEKTRRTQVEFDGVYWNSEVWINGHYLGKRPNGYISFAYDLTPFLKYGEESNELKVKVDNSKQPNSRWYSGSGIYRNVWLVSTADVFVDQSGTYVTTPEVSESKAIVRTSITVRNESGASQPVVVQIRVVDAGGKEWGSAEETVNVQSGSFAGVTPSVEITNPALWTLEEPFLYSLVTQVLVSGQEKDTYVTPFGIRYFDFDPVKGFSLNGKPTKIRGVCNHHDLGCLGSAINKSALRRQLEIMKEMGVNSIRTSHNPPAPELLDLCDEMGFLVMDEMFDMWKKSKTQFDYSQHWDEWHTRDLEDFIRRDRNHPSIIIWSIGNEILEQWDSTGTPMAIELARTVRQLDSTRLITTGNNDPRPENHIIKSGVLDLIGYNYKHGSFESFPADFPGQCFVATETTSALATRGHYDMPSDSIRRWPIRWDIPFTEGNPDHTVSSYDNVSAPWGSTHEETLKIMKKHHFLSGMYIWTGFDYLGEPTPYGWPSRSSYFGIVDLAGFPKDTYYLYQSEWTDKTVLHLFPHWNWEPGKVVDVWAYYNQADEVELFLNGKSLGTRSKQGDDLHVMWRVAFEPGTLRAVSRRNGNQVLERVLHTAGEAARITFTAHRQEASISNDDLFFLTATVVDSDGNVVPNADQLISFSTDGGGHVVATDNGDPTSHSSFRSDTRKAFHGLALCVVKPVQKGTLTVTATAEGLEGAKLELVAR